ncbi:MAG TPA: hypothetical protein VNK70_01070 [Candidatus Paceibacterota bacterium]|nr:hypothetical protein [Candidatus Paceibacterota bacterium]
MTKMKSKAQAKVKKLKPQKKFWGLFRFNFPAHKKNLDNMKLLVSYPEFQEAIKPAREYLGIPENGFKNNDRKMVQLWWRKIEEKSEEILDSPGFNKQLKQIRKKLDRREIGMRMARKQSQLLHHKIPINYLTNIARFLTEKFNVPENYKDHIRTYIIYGTISAPSNNFEGGEYPAWTLPQENRYIPIKIYTRLTSEDIKELKRYIEWIGKHLPRFQALKDTEKKLTIEQWFENRHKRDVVEGRDYKMSGAEIAENLLGDRKKSKKVYETVRELRELRQRRFGKR